MLAEDSDGDIRASDASDHSIIDGKGQELNGWPFVTK